MAAFHLQASRSREHIGIGLWRGNRGPVIQWNRSFRDVPLSEKIDKKNSAQMLNVAFHSLYCTPHPDGHQSRGPTNPNPSKSCSPTTWKRYLKKKGLWSKPRSDPKVAGQLRLVVRHGRSFAIMVIPCPPSPPVHRPAIFQKVTMRPTSGRWTSRSVKI